MLTQVPPSLVLQPDQRHSQGTLPLHWDKLSALCFCCQGRLTSWTVHLRLLSPEAGWQARVLTVGVSRVSSRLWCVCALGNHLCTLLNCVFSV